MNAPSKIEAPANLAIWNALCRTDPKHTKQFKRAGGFSGTALKPIWIVKQLTEQFGPVGIGWGIGRPDFTTIEAGGEVLVYCTVNCWHTAEDNFFFGVGGDKVATKRKDGSVFVDDEAFKKAFTDAVNNAFKFVGVGADIHMGQFEDSKYLREVSQEFAARESAGGQSQDGAVSPQRTKGENWGGRYPTKTALWAACKSHHAELDRLGMEATLSDLEDFLTSPEYSDYVKIATDHAPALLEGPPPEAMPEFIPTFQLEQKARDLIALRGNVPAYAEENN